MSTAVKHSLLSSIALLFLSLPLAATTIAPPANLGELARMSGGVVLARAGESRVDPHGFVPHTLTRFTLLEPVSGTVPSAEFEVVQPGGFVGDTGAAVSGAAVFHPERTYLLFLDPRRDGRWTTQMMAYGVLEEVPGKDLLRPIPEAEDLNVVAAGKTGERVEVYRERALLDLLAKLPFGGAWDRRQVVATPELAPPVDSVQPNQPAPCFFLGQDPVTKTGVPFRWRFETGTTATLFTTPPGQVGFADGGVSAVQQAIAAWTNHPDSLISFAYGGSTARTISCSASFDFQNGGVVFNDPCSDIADLVGCNGTLAFGGTFSSGTHTYDGGVWNTSTAAFAVVNNGAQCVGATNFAEAMTHELGHSLGFGHHSLAAPPNRPTMAPVLSNDGRGAALIGADRSCASFAYHTFLDVPYSHFSWSWIEAVENAGVILGCGGGNFCPAGPVTRDAMATFLLRAKHGGAYNPPACVTPMFNDVPCSHPLAAWINRLAAEGITNGCGNGNYCPNDAVNRIQMAIFILRTIEGPAYNPPACTTPVFADVPCSNPFAGWANELAARGITTGCGGGNYCPATVVQRAQMAIFLQRAFALPLPTP